ncbi:helicase C-terminal domain-containing protein [Thermosynechococcus sp. PKX82]|uniref:helicase C-terminal domain-containing protein n=1 Tax=Thermosynechococcus sp. PKX82 TaxID=3074086 RepID=UPI002872E841|nr:helicase C-terminal domain-containing protein [Thermosynechococcus sp. PKX82]WNC29739.1 ATP-dependent DNA helicase [Thermosynechococcus sp. PKX82]
MLFHSEQIVIEAEVHRQLRAFLRSSGDRQWPHHLTLARLVARALRLRRGCLLQVSQRAVLHHRYGLSYLLPLLLYPEPALLVVPQERLTRLLHQEIPELLTFLAVRKPIQHSQCPQPAFEGMLVMSLEDWCRHATAHPNVVTIIDGIEALPQIAQQQMTCTITTSDWEHLKLAIPSAVGAIRQVYAQLVQHLFQRPQNPYGDYLLTPTEQQSLLELLHQWPQALPPQWSQLRDYLNRSDTVIWGRRHPTVGYFSLQGHPLSFRAYFKDLWSQAPFVLIGSGPDTDSPLAYVQQELGIPPQTTIKFASDRHSEAITLAISEDLPLPNTPEFAPAVLRRLYDLIGTIGHRRAVILVSDVPLREQLATQLAALYGSRVQVETPTLDTNTILVTGEAFWLRHGAQLPCPALFVLTTLPLPSPEKAVVSARIEWHKQQKQDWFRQYLLPECLTILDRALAPVRQDETLVAILDRRLTERSYGREILQSLSPYNLVSDRARSRR